MAEEKHRMLFQDQDPGQDLQIERPMSLSPSEPPTYYDAMQTFTIQNNLDYSNDRRRTLFAEPQHLRSRVEEMPMPMPMSQMKDEVSVQSEGLADNNSIDHRAMPPVRSKCDGNYELNTHSIAYFEIVYWPDFFILSPQPKLGSQAMDIVCPACGQRGVTRLKRSPNARTNLWALCLCTFG